MLKSVSMVEIDERPKGKKRGAYADRSSPSVS